MLRMDCLRDTCGLSQTELIARRRHGASPETPPVLPRPAGISEAVTAAYCRILCSFVAARLEGTRKVNPAHRRTIPIRPREADFAAVEMREMRHGFRDRGQRREAIRRRRRRYAAAVGAARRARHDR